MAANDNWGWKARIGMFIVGSEPVPEAEWWAMTPTGVSLHVARVTAKAPWATWRDDKTSVELADDLLRGARQFASMRLNAVVIGHSSSSIVGGNGWDEAVVARLAAELGPDIAVTTNGLDSATAFRATGITRPFIILPAWFNDATVSRAVEYYKTLGFPPSGHLRYDPGRKWRDVPPGDLYPQGMGFEQEVESLYRQIRSACPPDADGVFIAGTGFRCVAILDDLEADLRRPVLSANQVSLWNCLRLSGVHTKVSGYGSLLNL